ncbi:MAG: Lrp/AsnC family transcriptional regulator [Silicimonas sp.]|nr:Lrp/AsnC family transcriptional regulator [Silicimonas sp.]NNF91247.1 Lrp/AsnC family transcriptional regulator [Boseongicola sp.]MBT8424710.1 Lrp/AsnC family transcriptional regulator [Silicimonas sp.]NND21584.1 Lrp/AsnC family transcriptional regulator [Silicimonas sp.]NND41139.1 Lrp/AsnC family transcriptional regulator [Silicimonas sp.]
MSVTIDAKDRRILNELQRDAGQGLEALAGRVGLSRNAAWRRIRRLEEEGIIRGRVALLDADALDLGLSVIIQVRTRQHDPAWLDNFARAMRVFPEIQGAYRMSGDLDYLIRARVRDMAAYDRLYQRLIREVDLADVSASFVMEEIKETTALAV